MCQWRQSIMEGRLKRAAHRASITKVAAKKLCGGCAARFPSRLRVMMNTLAGSLLHEIDAGAADVPAAPPQKSGR